MDLVLLTTAGASAFCFAFALVLTQLGLRTINPFLGASIALPTTAFLFLLISPKTFQWDEWHNQSAMIFATVGLFFPVAVTLLTFHANQCIGPTLTGTLGNLGPFFAVTLAILLLDETPQENHWVGISAIFTGVTLIILSGPKRYHSLTTIALGLPIAAAALRGAAQPFVKFGLANWPNPFAAVTIGYITSAIIIGGFLIIWRRDLRLPDRTGTAWFIAVGLINGAAVLLLYMALQKGPVTIVAPLVACYPLLTLILNRLCLGDRRLSGSTLLGVISTVIGISFLLKS